MATERHIYENGKAEGRKEAAAEIEKLRANLDRANRIIGWMMPYIGNMAPPDGGLGDLNDHFMENKVPNPKHEKCDRPIKQNRRG